MTAWRSWLYLCVGSGLLIAAIAKKPYTTWRDYAGGADSMQYSALKQINKSNVSRLELAWSYLVPGSGGRFGFNPVIVDGVMYVLGGDRAIVALDAATGKQIWSHPVDGNPTDRGINYWESKDRSDRRLIFAANNYLQQINAGTGLTINTFGNDGRVDLREGLGRDPKSIRNIQSGTPGRVFENLILTGSAPGEGYGSAPGHIRAYDVISGKLVWHSTRFHNPASMATTPGRRKHTNTLGEPTSGEKSRLTKREASATFRQDLPPMIFTALIAKARTSSAIVSSLWTSAPASDCGTFKLFIMTFGTMTSQLLRSC